MFLIRRRQMLALVAALLSLFVVIAILSGCAADALVVSTATRTLKITGEVIQRDSSSLVQPQGVNPAAVNANTAGLTPPGVEAATANPALRNAITKNNYIYAAIIQEATASSWTAGRTYCLQLYGDGVLKATLYFQNGTADDSKIEGVTLNVDLGSSSTYPQSYTLILTRTN